MPTIDPAAAPDVAEIWTIGHSTLPFDAFVARLRHHGIAAIADVRRFPGSRRHPWFASESLAHTLPGEGIGYTWLPELGGRRRVQPGSPNGGWRNASFQGYADHLDSAEFATGLARLLEFAARQHVAMMCAESLWWRCHRALVSDVLKHRGTTVWHVLDDAPPNEHPWTGPARIIDGRLAYPPVQGSLL
jgi:uncharacterized protein (DUF488 family)